MRIAMSVSIVVATVKLVHVSEQILDASRKCLGGKSANEPTYS